MEILVVIPAFNESTNIDFVINEVRAVLPESTIVVVDDGSEDDTASIAGACGVMVLKLPYNLGIGGAVQTGLRMAALLDAPYVIRLDGDGQHNPQEIPTLLASVIAGEADIVIGSRFCQGAFPISVSLPRRIGIYMFCGLTSWLSGQSVTDPTSGFMAMTLQVATFLANNMAQDYPEVDARVLLTRAGFRIKEIPAQMRERRGGISSISPSRAFYYAFKVTLSVFAARSRIMSRSSEVTSQDKRLVSEWMQLPHLRK